MLNSSSLAIIQKYILLATGTSNSAALRDKVAALNEQTDGLDKVAELADTFMAELDKYSDYNSSQTANAAREWLANIRATDESLATGIDAIQGLIDSFIDGNVQNKANAENGDGIKSSDENTTTIDRGAGDDRNVLII